MRIRDVFLGLIVTALVLAAQIPRFSDFHTAEVFAGQPAKPVFRTRLQGRFETQIRRQARLPANFGGHYKIAEWGCGSSCGSFAVIDLKTGNVYDGPFSVLDYGEAYRYEGGYDDLEYRISSRLLVARGCPECRRGSLARMSVRSVLDTGVAVSPAMP